MTHLQNRVNKISSIPPAGTAPRRFAQLSSVGVVLLVAPAFATTLTVDLSTAIGPARHVASGSLYGVTEAKPADVNGLIAPLRPRMFTNPATSGTGKQQPVGDAIAVAKRVASTGATVTLRLADWLPGWPYKFVSMTDWLDKVSQTYAQKQASGVNNYYGYEIWNEPDGTWTNSLSFNEFWRQTYVKLRQLDPSAKIIGPSISYYNSTYLKNFLTYAKANNCVPDIISWHELSGGNLTSNYSNYRSIETQAGVGPLPISINEYSGKDHLADEGRPGASAPMIAKFERFKFDSACITFWDVAHPGRLGTLLATDTATNGGWWFYKWYGELSGNMVTTVPPAPNDPVALDGFASLDATAAKASVLFAGVNDGSIQIVVKGFQAASVLGSKVHAVVDHTPFVSRSTVVTATSTISTTDLSVVNDQISVTVNGANNNSGYRLILTPVAGSTGGTAGAGGASGTGGTVAAGGTSSTGGSRPAGGSAAQGGASAKGGASPTGGTKAAGGTSNTVNSGGATTVPSTSSSVSLGGVTSAGGGNASTGGSVGSDGGGNAVGQGGTPSSVASGGMPSVGNQGSSSATTPNGGTYASSVVSADSSNDGSCSCRVAGQSSGFKSVALFGVMGWLLMRARRRASQAC